MSVRRDQWQSVSGYDTARPINVELAIPEWLYVHGNNGVGKSTLLEGIAGLQRLTTGYVRINETLLQPGDLRSRPRAGLYYVPQHSRWSEAMHITDALSVVERAYPAIYNEAAIKDLVQCFQQHDLFDESGILLPRVFDLFLAVCCVPSVLLLDEAGPIGRREDDPSAVYDLLREVLPWTCVIFTEHFAQVGIRYADKVLSLSAVDPPKLLATDEAGKSLLTIAFETQVEDIWWDSGPAGSGVQSVALDRPIADELLTALRARGLTRRSEIQRVVTDVLKDFPFFGNADGLDLSWRPVGTLSGGQRVVFSWFLHEFSGIGTFQSEHLRHLDSSNRAALLRWRKRVEAQRETGSTTRKDVETSGRR